MATDLENSIRTAAERVVSYIDNVATLSVKTQYVVVDAAGDFVFDQAKPLALTEIRFDGDSEAIVPMRISATDRLELDTGLLELHQANVDTAIEYRARILESLVGLLKSSRA